MKILLIATSRSSFVNQDHLILKKNFDTELVICWSLREIFSTFKKVLTADVCFFWFASIRFFPVFVLAKILMKKTIVVAGGYDVSRVPEFNYGGMNSQNLLTYFRKFMLHRCDKVITVSDSNTKETTENALVPSGKIERIYLGVEKPVIQLKEWSQRKNQVVFIASCDQTSYKIKGFHTFLELARRMPDVTFLHIGDIQIKEFRDECGKISNIKNLGWLENMGQVFSEILNNSKIILQPSRIESFGVAVAEGGLHGCIPVVSNEYSLPEIAGEYGRSCSFQDVAAFQSAIREVLQKDYDVSGIQKYYFNRFSTVYREEKLIKLLKAYV